MTPTPPRPVPAGVADSPLLRVVLAATRRDHDEPTANAALADVEPKQLIDAAWAHRINHLVADWLRVEAPDHPAMEELSARAIAATRTHLRAVAALRRATTALDAAGIAYAAMKGPVTATLMATLDPAASVRGYGDLDLLVAGRDLPGAVDALLADGSEMAPGAWRVATETHHAQVPLTLPHGISLDLHWHLLSQRVRRRATTIEPSAALLARRRPVSIAGTEFSTLDADDLVVHTIGHAGWSGGDRLGWFADIDAVIRATTGINWDIVVARTNQWGLGPLVGNTLARTVDLLGTPVPTDVLEQLRRSRFAGVLERASAFAPLSGMPNDYSVSRFLRVDARDGTIATSAAFAGRLVVAAARRVPVVGHRLHLPNDEPADLSTSLDAHPESEADAARWRSRYVELIASVESGQERQRRLRPTIRA